MLTTGRRGVLGAHTPQPGPAGPSQPPSLGLQTSSPQGLGRTHRFPKMADRRRWDGPSF